MAGHHSFDHAAQEGNLWLRELGELLRFDHPGQDLAALRAALHALRDQLSAEAAVHLSAQLPMMIRGLFFEGWRMHPTQKVGHSLDSFSDAIAAQLPPNFPHDPQIVASAVFELMWTRLDTREIAKIIDTLPRSQRQLWPAIARIA